MDKSIIPSFIVSRAVSVVASLAHSSRFRSTGLYSPRRPSVGGGVVTAVDMKANLGVSLSVIRRASVETAINGTGELSGLAAVRGEGGPLLGGG